jgi:hypothetical protein
VSLYRHSGPYEHDNHTHYPAGLCLKADGNGHAYMWRTECEICSKEFLWSGVLRHAPKRCRRHEKRKTIN